jgi:hypothetical protein
VRSIIGKTAIRRKHVEEDEHGSVAGFGHL